jgi:hypothetical protein
MLLGISTDEAVKRGVPIGLRRRTRLRPNPQILGDLGEVVRREALKAAAFEASDAGRPVVGEEVCPLSGAFGPLGGSLP